MYIARRWVSMELANTSLIPWVVAVAALGIVDWWLSRRRPPKSPAKDVVIRRRLAKRQKR